MKLGALYISPVGMAWVQILVPSSTAFFRPLEGAGPEVKQPRLKPASVRDASIAC